MLEGLSGGNFLGAVGVNYFDRGMWERDGPKVNLHATGALASILGGCQPHQSFQQKSKCYQVT